MYYEPTTRFTAWAKGFFKTSYLDRVTAVRVKRLNSKLKLDLKKFASLQNVIVPDYLVDKVEAVGRPVSIGRFGDKKAFSELTFE